MSDLSDRKTILVVDDTPANIALLLNILKADYRTKVATNGEKALSVAFAGEPPDLVLLDIMMPDMDGYQVCSRLKANPATCDVPVIFVTGLSEADDEEKGLALGAADYITKPVSPALVLARVRSQLLLAQQKKRLAPPAPRLSQLPVLALEIRDGTGLLVDPEQAWAVLTRLQAGLQPLLARHGAALDWANGQQLQVYFDGNDPLVQRQAAALALAREVRQAWAGIAQDKPLGLALGLASGAAMIAPGGMRSLPAVAGGASHLALALAAAAQAGQILVSQALAEALAATQDGQLVPCDELRLPGLTGVCLEAAAA